MMSDMSRQAFPDEIRHIFAELDPRDVEQFYASYQQWALQQQIASLLANISALQQDIAENNERMQRVHPSAIALATLARLQSNGVTDIELLDHMLERGETWLDQTMQHLDYCERLDFMRDTYTEWCRHALEGAYDWIDSIHDEDALAPAAATSEALNLATEETLLQKLMSDEVEEKEATSMLATTLKIWVVTPAEQTQETVDSGVPVEVVEQIVEAVEAVDSGVNAEEKAMVEQPQKEEETPDPSFTPLVQEAPSEQVEVDANLVPSAKLLPTETSDTVETTLREATETSSPSEDSLPLELEEVAAPIILEEILPVETNDTNDTTSTFDDTPVDSHHISRSITAPLPPLELAGDHKGSRSITAPLPPLQEDDVPIEADQESEHLELVLEAEEPHPTSSVWLWSWEESSPSEPNTVADQTATPVSTQQSNMQVLQDEQPPQKRNFLQRLFSVFRRR
jgi:hypothetical protein